MALSSKAARAVIAVLATGPLTAAAQVPAAPATPAAPAASVAANPAPQVVPSLREWSGGSGSYALTNGSRIVIDASNLRDEAELLRNDLSEVTGFAPRLVTGSQPESGRPVLVRPRIRSRPGGVPAQDR